MDSNPFNAIIENFVNQKVKRVKFLIVLVVFTYFILVIFTIFSAVFFKNGWILWFIWADFLIVSLLFYEYSFIMPLFFFPLSFFLLYTCDYNIFEGEVAYLPGALGGVLELLVKVADGIQLFGAEGSTKIHFALIYRHIWENYLLDFTVLSFRFINAAPYTFTGVILFFPLVSSLILLMFGKKIGNKFAGLFSSGMIGIAASSAFFFWFIYPVLVFKFTTHLLRLFLKEYNYHLKIIERIFTDPYTANFSWDEVVEVVLNHHAEWIRASAIFFKYNIENPFILRLYTKMDPEVFLNFGDIVSFFSMNFTWSLKFDNLTLAMSFVILSISLAVHLFSCDYMKNDVNQVRFFAFLSLFTFFMLLLVSAHDFIVFYIAWEGVGVCSFLLISFWFTRVQAIKAAIKALLINKIGDVCLLIAGAIIFKFCLSLDFGVVFFLFPVTGNVLIPGTGFTHIDLVCLLLMLASLIKSAQLFFHVWLADAMEGPTPVSALLHAATMVTAGVFLIIRFSFIFEYSPVVLNLLTFVSVLTIVIVGVIGMFQYDIKKIIAYSTCSQLGIMFLACSLSGYTFALFHFFNHAFFKALLFMSAGNIIHALGNEQDIRKMGGLKNILPFSYMTLLISSLSLVGFPFFSGYYSKDAIILLAYSKLVVTSDSPSPILYYTIIVSLMLTCFYSFRLIYYVFLGNSTRVSCYLHKNIKEDLNFFNAGPLFILALLSIFSGYLFNFYFIGVGSNFFYEASILTFCDDIKYYLFYREAKAFILFILLFSYLICLVFCHAKESVVNTSFKFYYNSWLRKIFSFFNKKGYFDDLYNLFLNSKIYKLGHTAYEIVDKGILEIFGPRGAGRLVFKVSRALKKLYNSGPITHLIYLMLLGVLILLFIVIMLL